MVPNLSPFLQKFPVSTKKFYPIWIRVSIINALYSASMRLLNQMLNLS